MNQLDELKQAYCLSSHAACNPHMTSHVLDAIQRSPSEQARCLRISLGLHSDQTTVLDLIAQINALVHVNA
jgi:cysteine sulfinate desulfinase/cysteine desulfurase-like protein